MEKLLNSNKDKSSVDLSTLLTSPQTKKLIGVGLIALTLLGTFDPILRTATIAGIVQCAIVDLRSLPKLLTNQITSDNTK